MEATSGTYKKTRRDRKLALLFSWDAKKMLGRAPTNPVGGQQFTSNNKIYSLCCIKLNNIWHNLKDIIQCKFKYSFTFLVVEYCI